MDPLSVTTAEQNETENKLPDQGKQDKGAYQFFSLPDKDLAWRHFLMEHPRFIEKPGQEKIKTTKCIDIYGGRGHPRLLKDMIKKHPDDQDAAYDVQRIVPFGDYFFCYHNGLSCDDRTTLIIHYFQILASGKSVLPNFGATRNLHPF